MPEDRADLLVEIGCEELPPAAVEAGRSGLGRAAEKHLRENRLPPEEVLTYATPRRLVLLVRGVPREQEAEVKEVTGPPKKVAYDADGKLTAAGLGFLKKYDLAEGQIKIVETAKGEYLGAEVASPRGAAAEVLTELVPACVGELSFAKTMRWPPADVAFPRPVRWLVGLFGGEVAPFAYAGLTAGTASAGHRTIAPGEKDLAGLFADGRVDPGGLKGFYERELGVVLDAGDRAARVKEALPDVGVPADYFERADFHIKWTFGRVLDEVEAPLVVAGNFDEKYLSLPAEVVEAALLGYLHLFPVWDKEGRLTPAFFAVSNARPDAVANVRAGLERVLAARLADASYFWEVDSGTPPDEMAAALGGVVFAKGAGTVADKAARLGKLVAALADELDVPAGERPTLARAAALCKADLTSQMVREKEFAHLQGTMGRLYAAAAGEPEGVALAIEEHYRPGAADDPLPTTLAGRVLALADRADTLVTLFAAGHRPTGAKDPFALRRAAIGLCRILLEDADGAFAPLTLEAIVGLAAKVAASSEDAATDVLSFVEGRLRQNFLDRGYRDDMVEAVLAGEGRKPADRAARLDALASFYENRDEYLRLAIAFKRPINILRQGRERELAWGNFDEGLIGQDEERALLDEFRAVEPDVGAAISGGDYGRALELLAKMRPTVDKYFDEVMVMCEDEKLRANRLAMMQLLADLFLSFADFTRLRGEEDYE